MQSPSDSCLWCTLSDSTHKFFFFPQAQLNTFLQWVIQLWCSDAVVENERTGLSTTTKKSPECFICALKVTSPAIVVVPTEVTPSEATLPLQHACDNMHGNQLPDTTSSLDDYTGRLNTTAATFLSEVNFSIQLEVIFPMNRLCFQPHCNTVRSFSVGNSMTSHIWVGYLTGMYTVTARTIKLQNRITQTAWKSTVWKCQITDQDRTSR